MSFLSTALDRLMKERDWTQTELERRTGIAQSNISRYLNSVVPDGEVLEKLVAAFESDASVLVGAWVQDLVPVKLRHLVNISPADFSIVAEGPNDQRYLDHHPPPLATLIRVVAPAPARDPDVMAVFQSTMALISKRRLGQG